MKHLLILAGALTLACCSRAPEPRADPGKDTGSVAGEVPDRPAALPSKIPADVPAYPGATLTGTFAAPGGGADGQPAAYQYEFQTPDPPAKVMSYYHRQLEEHGMKLALHTDTADGGMFVAEDDRGRRTVNIIVDKGQSGTEIRVTLRPKK